MKIDTNAPASTMTVRDHFAGLALQAIVANDIYRLGSWDDKELPSKGNWDYGDSDEWAYQAYFIADSMLAARGKPSDHPALSGDKP